MKKIYCLLLILAFACLSIGAEEEIDFLLFMPNSSSSFVDEVQAMVHLDNLAGYLNNRDLSPGQIRIDGYTADVANDIDSLVLSMERALYVIEELQRRGVRENLFSSPGAFGAVDFWGNNIDESQRSPNRRVIISIDGLVITTDTIEPVPPPAAPAPVPRQEAPRQEPVSESRGFPWWLLLIPLALILFLALKRRKKPEEKPAAPAADEPAEEKELPAAVPPPEAVPVPVALVTAAPVPIEFAYVDLIEEIRFRAYELYLDRHGQSENREEDWHRAVLEVCARYQAAGHETYIEDEIWWARREK